MLTARLLGRFWMTVDGQVVDTFSSRRTRNVLAYLLAHREAPVQRDVLMNAFWPDASPQSARNSLHVALSGVRRVLRAAQPEPLVERWHDTYRLVDRIDVWVDVEEFERHYHAARRAEQTGDAKAALRSYELAAQLYEGDFLADDPYVEWAAGIREALRVQAIEAQCRLMTLYAGRGDHGGATLLGRRILSVDPCNELVHRQLMTSYALSAQNHLAMLQYHRCRKALWSAFRVGPSAETVELYERLRRSVPLRLPTTSRGILQDRGPLPPSALHVQASRFGV
jgi:SARP family transcriptional regulator, regulator of embCAB operon